MWPIVLDISEEGSVKRRFMCPQEETWKSLGILGISGFLPYLDIPVPLLLSFCSLWTGIQDSAHFSV